MTNYMLVGKHDWNFDVYTSLSENFPQHTFVWGEPDIDFIDIVNPRYIFFLHWSEKVPVEITATRECVCFHPTPLPYGRGGTPIQNMILAGHIQTKLTAFKMTQELDAGPIYNQRSMSLAGPLHSIFNREMALAYDMLVDIIENEPQPKPQVGEPVYFKRRTPEQSELPKTGDIQGFIDMLDAPGYPHASIEWGDFRIEFTAATTDGDGIQATARINKRESK